MKKEETIRLKTQNQSTKVYFSYSQNDQDTASVNQFCIGTPNTPEQRVSESQNVNSRFTTKQNQL